jgi:hypothetical protein
VCRRLIAVNPEPCSANGLQREEEGHADDRSQEQESSSETFDHGGRSERPGEIPNLQDTVDEQLIALLVHPNEQKGKEMAST